MLHQSLLAQNEYERKIIYDWSNENRAMLFFVLVNTQKVWELFHMSHIFPKPRYLVTFFLHH